MTNIEKLFVKRFGKDAADAIWRCAEEHGNGINNKNRGSDSFKWALLIVIGYQCVELDGYRSYHGIPDELPFSEFKSWVRGNAELGTHDGDCDYMCMFAGGYNDYVSAPSDTRLDNKELLELCEKATPGPWRCEEMGSEGWTVFANRLSMPHLKVLSTNLSAGDAQLIAAARTELPRLVRENEALRRYIKAFETACGPCDWDCTPEEHAEYEAAKSALKVSP